MSPEPWIEEYSASRYLQKQSDEMLRSRLEVLAANLWSTDADFSVIAPRNPQHREAILRVITHVFCEQFLRTDGTEPLSIDEAAIRRAASSAYIPPKLTTQFIGSPSGFAKFGKREHIRRAFEEGVLKVSPASGFDDASLNPAQRDDELQHWAASPNETLMMKLYSSDKQGNKVEIPIEKGTMFRGMNVPNFYVWCCGFGFDARLFQEFGDAVIVIRDMDEFRSRFYNAMELVLPNWAMKDSPLSYYDPFTVGRQNLIPIFSKKLQYLYQNEYRFAWTPHAQEKALKPLFPVLGPLTNIAEFYEIDASS